jgi:hydroxyethylthiazole kinase
MNFKLIEKIRKENPLIYNITNVVVSNDTANGLLAIGASPFMSNAPEEAGEIAGIAGAVVINIGTINAEQTEAMIAAGKAANEAGNPVILDPVGVGATVFRKKIVNKLLEKIKISVIRGNLGEIATIAGVEWNSKGVDTGYGNDNASGIEIAKIVANKYNCIVGISGATDMVTNGEKVTLIRNGTSYFTKMTGGGCLLSSICAAFAAVSINDLFTSIETAMCVYAICGEIVSNGMEEMLVGSFRSKLLDELSVIDESTVNSFAKFESR